MSRLLAVLALMSLVVAACGGGGDGTSDSGSSDSATNETTSEPTVSDEGSDSAGGDDPVGTATIDGTEYTLVASLQCLVALEQANQISISGDVEEYESDEPYEWTYDWDSDDGYNEFSITVGDDPQADEYRGRDTFSDPVVNGESVTASGTVVSGGINSFEASFEIDCDS